MDTVNKCIACDVYDCKFNAMGRNCSLAKIKVSGGSRANTYCGSYQSRT